MIRCRVRGQDIRPDEMLFPRLVEAYIQLDREFRGALEGRLPVQVQSLGLRMVMRREYGPRDVQGTSEVGLAGPFGPTRPQTDPEGMASATSPTTVRVPKRLVSPAVDTPSGPPDRFPSDTSSVR